ncbi:MAG: BON domain-containing protein [Labilithrix sp.]|nr:BON domain-containing protein [Labilithrix sp.]MCW5815534.1 BON domain-containing protein [Labilithrix sp.]
MSSRLVMVVLAGALFACGGTDADVNRRVSIRLNREPTPAEQLTVTTHKRVVRLKGVVHSQAERERLERAAREVDGVAGVENQLVVEAPVELTAGTYLTHDPVDALLRDNVRARLDAQALDDIAVEVKDHVITLKGKVPRTVHDAALKIATEATQGSDARVEDELEVLEEP